MSILKIERAKCTIVKSRLSGLSIHLNLICIEGETASLSYQKIGKCI